MKGRTRSNPACATPNLLDQQAGHQLSSCGRAGVRACGRAGAHGHPAGLIGRLHSRAAARSCPAAQRARDLRAPNGAVAASCGGERRRRLSCGPLVSPGRARERRLGRCRKPQRSTNRQAAEAAVALSTPPRDWQLSGASPSARRRELRQQAPRLRGASRCPASERSRRTRHRCCAPRTPVSTTR
jgi:hypothetical protein